VASDYVEACLLYIDESCHGAVRGGGRAEMAMPTSVTEGPCKVFICDVWVILKLSSAKHK
jgi:hypothetical protein